MSDPQTDLFSPVREVEKDRTDYPVGFWEWLEKNEHIYRAFVQIAFNAKNAGFPRWAAHAIIQKLRWETALRDGYQNRVKISNNCFPGLSRLAMAEYEELDGFFATHSMGRRAGIRLNGEDYGSEP